MRDEAMQRVKRTGQQRPHGRRPRWAVLAVLGVVAVLVVFAMWDRAPSTSAPQTVPTRTPAADSPRVVVVGDSYTAGSTQDSGEAARWPALIDVEPIAVSGVGSARGTTTFSSLAEDIPANATTVLFFGSINDQGLGYDKVRAGAQQAFETARERAPDAQLIVIGPPWVDANPSDALLTVRDAVAGAAQAADARWVDPLAEQWFVGQEGLIGFDGIHHTDTGHAYLAERIAKVLAEP